MSKKPTEFKYWFFWQQIKILNSDRIQTNVFQSRIEHITSRPLRFAVLGLYKFQFH